ncbi:hypothetical protein [Kitasatospora sp. NPDC051164]|uniref:hypothetical protein n=1 Tax=Kitasatospora sp. NPDC051164 TaxID=3364055 RepID=UPI0037A1EF89
MHRSTIDFTKSVPEAEQPSQYSSGARRSLDEEFRVGGVDVLHRGGARDPEGPFRHDLQHLTHNAVNTNPHAAPENSLLLPRAIALLHHRGLREAAEQTALALGEPDTSPPAENPSLSRRAAAGLLLDAPWKKVVGRCRSDRVPFDVMMCGGSPHGDTTTRRGTTWINC